MADGTKYVVWIDGMMKAVSSAISLISYTLSCQIVFVSSQQQELAGGKPRNLRGGSSNSHQPVTEIDESQFNRTLVSPVHFETADAGSNGRIQPRIVGGNQAGFGEYPYYVDMGGCGGSLIAPDLVLSAAHCGNYYGQFITVGAYKRLQGARVQVVNWARHPSFNEALFEYDFAIMKISPPVAINSGNVQFFLNAQRNLRDYEGLDVIGMGSQLEGGGLSSTLRDLSTRKLPTTLCNRRNWYGGRVNDATMFCAGYRRGERDSCQGDSGSPIIRKVGNQHIQVGLVSWGEGCARQRRPGVYARVSAGYNWIWDKGCNQWGSRGGICGGGSQPSNQQNIQQQNPSSCPANHYLFDFTMKTDGGGGNMSWSLVNRSSKVRIYQKKNMGNFQTYRTALCIPIAPYQLLIRDKAGDGLQGGGYELRLNGGLSLSNYDNAPFRRRTVEW